MNNCFFICITLFDIWDKASGNSLCIHNTPTQMGVPPCNSVIRSARYEEFTFPLHSMRFLP
jgi:hypothetical protein